MVTVPTNYIEVTEILAAKFEEVFSGYEFYKFIFPNNENSGDMRTNYTRPNAIYLYKNDGYVEPKNMNQLSLFADEEADERLPIEKRRFFRRIMLNDTWKDDYVAYVEGCELTLCSGLAYRSKANTLEHAQCMNAMIFDLDNVGRTELMVLFQKMAAKKENPFRIPIPTFIVASGTGLHLYYVFEEPIDLFPNIKLQLKKMKKELTEKIWVYKATSKNKSVQVQGINQGFRMVGSINGKYGTAVRAFKVGKRIPLAYLNEFVADIYKVDITKKFKERTMTKAEAAVAFPDWYQRVVVEHHPRNKWRLCDQKGHNGDEIYQWWRKQIHLATGGHRYFYMMCLAIYASKCDVPRETLKKDMLEAFEWLKTNVEHKNGQGEYDELDLNDVRSAMEMYSKDFYAFKLDDIESVMDIKGQIKRNKRNGRKQVEHLKVMRAIQSAIDPSGDWRNKNGAPDKSQVVAEFRFRHPDATVSEIARVLGLSRNTVKKWWDAEYEQPEEPELVGFEEPNWEEIKLEEEEFWKQIELEEQERDREFERELAHSIEIETWGVHVVED